MNTTEPSTYTIRDLDTLRVISDPLRTQIFDLCVTQPRTVREIAGLLNLAPTRLYYHINMLEKHGLIVVDETRQVGNLLEKRYRAVATKLDIENSLFTMETSQSKESMNTLVRSMLDSTRDDLLRSLDARATARLQGAEPKERELVLYHVGTKVSDERSAEFLQRLKALLSEFEATDMPGEQTYGLTVAYYPVFYYPGQADAEEPSKV